MVNSVLTTIPLEHCNFISKYGADIYRIEMPIKKSFNDYNQVDDAQEINQIPKNVKSSRFSVYDILNGKTPTKRNTNCDQEDGQKRVDTVSPFKIPKYRKTQIVYSSFKTFDKPKNYFTDSVTNKNMQIEEDLQSKNL